MSCSALPTLPVASTSQLQQQMNDHPSPPPFSSTSRALLPPSLREILDAFAQSGGGDRELLLAILAAKTAEEDRLASTLSLRNQLFLLQSQHQQPFHMIPHQPRTSQGLDDTPLSPSSLSSSSSSASHDGPSTPPPPPTSIETDSFIGPIRSAKLSLVRANLLARKQQQQQTTTRTTTQRWSNASSVSPPLPPPAARRRSPMPVEVVTRESPEATRVALSGLLGVGVAGLGASSVRPKESFVRAAAGGGSEEQEEEEMEEVVVRRVKEEGRE